MPPDSRRVAVDFRPLPNGLTFESSSIRSLKLGGAGEIADSLAARGLLDAHQLHDASGDVPVLNIQVAVLVPR